MEQLLLLLLPQSAGISEMSNIPHRRSLVLPSTPYSNYPGRPRGGMTSKQGICDRLRIWIRSRSLTNKNMISPLDLKWTRPNSFSHNLSDVWLYLWKERGKKERGKRRTEREESKIHLYSSFWDVGFPLHNIYVGSSSESRLVEWIGGWAVLEKCVM